MVDIGSVGDAATAGLISGAIEKPTGQAGEAHHNCSDCGAPLTGRFCANCGQPAHVHRSLLHLGEEILHGVMHFDSRAWRTIPMLLFRPGQLTREWVQGKRTRYVSPLAIFLFTIFVMFMLLSYAPPPPAKTLAMVEAENASGVAKRAAKVAEIERQLAMAATPEARAEAEDALKAARSDLADAQQTLEGVKTAGEMMGNGDWKSRVAAKARSGKLNLNLGDEKLEEKLIHKLENPELFVYKLQQTFYKFSFLLIPISIPFVALLFLWKRGFTLYDHGVFVLYSLTFMSLLITVAAIASRTGSWAITAAWAVIPFIVPAHMYFQLKGAYGLGWFSAAWRTWCLLWFCLWALVLFGLAVIYLGLI
jgi:hypothetical protein